eukprot:506618-Rhodomonas_salina.1
MSLLVKETLQELATQNNAGLQQLASLVLHASAEQFLIDLFKNAGKDDPHKLGIHEIQQAWKEYLDGKQSTLKLRYGEDFSDQDIEADLNQKQ